MTSRGTIAGAEWLTRDETLALVAALDRDAKSPTLRFVGGCVRNTLLGLPVEDIDVATVHPPERVIELATSAGLKPVPTGLAHGTVTVVVRGKPYEVTTLRVDVSTDGRRAEVAFTDDWAADAGRRDFTMNAIYADSSGALFDPVGGLADLAARRVRFIGDAHARINEDYLRILRFFRFHAWYGDGPLDTDGLEACKSEREGLRRLSAERVQKELLRLLEAPNPVPVLRAMHQSGVLTEILPEVDDPHREERVERLSSLITVERDHLHCSDPIRRLAAICGVLHEDAWTLANRLRLSKADSERLVKFSEEMVEEPFRHEIDDRSFRALLYGQGTDLVIDRIIAAWMRNPNRHVQQWMSLVARAMSYRPPKLPITGHDVMALGISGARVGEVLNAVEAWWVAEDFLPRREAALTKAKELSLQA